MGVEAYVFAVAKRAGFIGPEGSKNINTTTKGFVLNTSFASKLRKYLVAAISGALALSTISAIPASAAGSVYATGDAVADSYVTITQNLDQNGEVTVPEGTSSLTVDLYVQLLSGFFTDHVGKTITMSRTVTGPDNTVISSGNVYELYGSPSLYFCNQDTPQVCKSTWQQSPPSNSLVAEAGQTNGSITFYTNVNPSYSMDDFEQKTIPAGKYKFEFKVTADGVEVPIDDVNLSIGSIDTRISKNGVNSYTVDSGVDSVNMSSTVCVDSAKIAAGDVLTPTFYVNDVAQTLQSWNINTITRSGDAPNKRNFGGNQAQTVTVNSGNFDDVTYGLAFHLYQMLDAFGPTPISAGQTLNWTIGVVDQNGEDVTGSCKPGTPGKPTISYDSNSNRVTATITSAASFSEGSQCAFYKTTDLNTVAATSFAWSMMPNTPATCSLNSPTPGSSYVVKVRGTWYGVFGEYSPPSDSVLVPAPGITVDPAVSGVTDVAGQVSVVSSDVDHFTGNSGTRILPDGKGGAYRVYTFSTVQSFPPNCGPPTYSYKLRQSNASGWVADFAGTGTVDFSPSGIGGGGQLVGWYGAEGDKWSLGATSSDPAAQGAGQLELIQGTNSSASTTSVKVNRAEVQATCDELGSGYSTSSMANNTSVSGYIVSANTNKQLFMLSCFKAVTMSDNVTTAYLNNPVLVTIDGNNSLTVVKAFGEQSDSVDSTQVGVTINPTAGANDAAVTVFVTKKNVTAYTNNAETGTVTAREIVRIKSDLTSTVTTSGWESSGTSISNEPAMLQPAVNNGDYFVMQRTNGMPSATFKIAKVSASGAVGSMVDVTIDKATELVGANLAFPIGVQSASASAVQVVATAPGMGMGAATSISVVSVNTSTGAAKAGEIVKYTTSGQSYLLINNFMVDPSTNDVHWWFSDATAASDKLSIYKWRDHLYVKPVGPVPAVTSKNLEYATNTPAAGTKVTFTGTNLDLATAVKFGTAAATLGTKTATSLEVTVPAGTGTVAITIESANGNAAAGNFTYVGANKVAQTVTLDAGANTATVGDADRTLSATVAMTGYTAVESLTYSSTTASVCTVTGNKLKFVAKGTCSVKATQAGSSWTAEGVATKDITVAGPDAQTITIKAPSTGEKMIGLDGFFIYPSTNSGLPLSIRFDTPTVCKKGTYGATHVVNVKTGSCKITVLAGGNAQWLASTKTLSYTVAKAGTTKITDAGNVNAPVILNGNGAKTNVLSEVVSWKKSTGSLTIASKSVWVGPITATATIKVGSKTYSCTVKYGTLKAASATSVKTIASPAALCSGKTASEKAALAALKKLSEPMVIKIVVVRDLRNPAKYTTKGQSIARAIYVTVG
jgi:hypothetical protein